MPTDTSPPASSESVELDRDEFGRLFSRHARRIYGFILTLVFSHHDAEEVFQNTSVVLWDKFGDFQPGSNFFAWASRIAYFEVLNLMKQQRRSQLLSEQTLDALATEAFTLAEQSGSREEALAECLSRLTVADRDLVQQRYYLQRPPKQIAAAQSRSVDSVYRALSRIHNVLLRCVERTLATEELS